MKRSFTIDHKLFAHISIAWSAYIVRMHLYCWSAYIFGYIQVFDAAEVEPIVECVAGILLLYADTEELSVPSADEDHDSLVLQVLENIFILVCSTCVVRL